LQDLAHAIVGNRDHHHHPNVGSASGDNDNNSSATSGSSTSSPALNQFLASLQGSATQNSALNPATIIFNTLSSAGITS